MAQMHGIAGEWARVKGTVAGLWPVFAGVFAAGFSTALGLFASAHWGIALFTLSLIAVCVTVAKGLRRVERFFVGARGEERVSRILSELPDKYHVFNDFVAGRTHVDHVVVGPAGVFAVETKFWRGKVTVDDGHILVDGQLPSRAPLAQVQREAAQVKAHLGKAGWSGTVTPVLAFASNTFQAHIAELGGVVVLNAAEISRSFSTERVVLPPDELARLVSIMENEQ